MLRGSPRTSAPSSSRQVFEQRGGHRLPGGVAIVDGKPQTVEAAIELHHFAASQVGQVRLQRRLVVGAGLDHRIGQVDLGDLDVPQELVGVGRAGRGIHGQHAAGRQTVGRSAVDPPLIGLRGAELQRYAAARRRFVQHEMVEGRAFHQRRGENAAHGNVLGVDLLRQLAIGGRAAALVQRADQGKGQEPVIFAAGVRIGVLALGFGLRRLTGVKGHQAGQIGRPRGRHGRGLHGAGPLLRGDDRLFRQQLPLGNGPHPLGAVAADHGRRMAGVENDPHQRPAVEDRLQPLADLVVHDAVGDAARRAVGLDPLNVLRAEDLVHAVRLVVLHPIVIERDGLLRTVARHEDDHLVVWAGPLCQIGKRLADVLAGGMRVGGGMRETGDVLHRESITLDQRLAEQGDVFFRTGKLAPFGQGGIIRATYQERAALRLGRGHAQRHAENCQER